MIIDMHTHVLPGIDDGAKHLRMSTKMLLASAKAGVEKVIATPHYYPWKSNTTAEQIRRLCKDVQEELRVEYGIDMKIYPGQEIVYEVGIVDALKSGNVLTLADSRYVLLEFMPDEMFSVMYRAVRELEEAGYVPIFAHIERYQCLQKKENVKHLRECGTLFQMNIDSVGSTLFSKKGRWVRSMLKNQEIDFLASDMHNLTSRSPYTKEKVEMLQKKIELKYLEKLLYENFERMVIRG